MGLLSHLITKKMYCAYNTVDPPTTKGSGPYPEIVPIFGEFMDCQMFSQNTVLC